MARRGRATRAAQQQDDRRRAARAVDGEGQAVFSKFGVLSERELAARVEIAWERYVKVGNIEASAALDIARDDDPARGGALPGQLYAVGPASRASSAVRTTLPG